MASRILILVGVYFFSFSTKAQNLDINWLRDINLNRNTSLDSGFKFISNSAVPLSIATPIIIYAVGSLTKDSNQKNQGVFIGESFIISSVLTTTLKVTFKRERPFITYPDIDKQSDGGGYSFPSGHNATAFATATALSLAFPKWYIIVPSYVWATAVGYSRMDLGVHYPSDVLAGAIVGSGSAYLAYKINTWIAKKK